jgi:hypothetical protein
VLWDSATAEEAHDRLISLASEKIDGEAACAFLEHCLAISHLKCEKSMLRIDTLSSNILRIIAEFEELRVSKGETDGSRGAGLVNG